MADTLGWYIPTAVTTTATVGDTTRLVLADEIRDDEAGYTMPARHWIYARTGAQSGTQRRLLSHASGHLGPMGAVQTSRPWDDELLAGTVIEITSPLPVKRHLGVKGLHECMNEGLSMIRVAAVLTLTGNGTRSVSLEDYPWVTSEDQIIGVYDTVWSTDSISEISPYPWEFVANGVDRQVITQFAYDSGSTFYLRVIVPADRLVFDGSSWSFVDTPGLQNDTYQAACSERWGLVFGMIAALRFCERMAARKDISEEEREPYRAALFTAAGRPRKTAWVTAARSIQRTEFPKPLQKPYGGMVSIYQPPSWP